MLQEVEFPSVGLACFLDLTCWQRKLIAVGLVLEKAPCCRIPSNGELVCWDLGLVVGVGWVGGWVQQASHG